MDDFKAGDVVSVEFFGRSDGLKRKHTYYHRAIVQSVPEPFDGTLLVKWAKGGGVESVSASRCHNRSATYTQPLIPTKYRKSRG